MGLTLAIGDFNLSPTIGFGLTMACYSAVMPFLLRSANRDWRELGVVEERT